MVFIVWGGMGAQPTDTGEGFQGTGIGAMTGTSFPTLNITKQRKGHLGRWKAFGI